MSNVLELQKVTKAYPDGDEQLTILDEVSLSVEAGEFVAILGPSGSGKSTLLSIAGLLLSADQGKIFISGEEQTKSSQKQRTRIRREKLGFIFQNHQLLPYLTVVEQLEQVATFSNGNRQEVHQSIMALLNDLGIAQSAHKHPGQLSGGQRQRVAIARAFINHPQLILADEPTASLDAERGRQVIELIRQEAKQHKAGALMVTHDERVLDLVDSIYRLENAKLVQQSKF